MPMLPKTTKIRNYGQRQLKPIGTLQVTYNIWYECICITFLNFFFFLIQTYDLEQFGNALQYTQDAEVSLLSSSLLFYASNTHTIVTTLFTRLENLYDY